MPSPVRKPPKSKQFGPRRDPATTSRFDGMPPGFAIQNADPNRHYIWAHREDRQCGEWRFRAMGYRIEVHSADGVSTLGQRGEDDTPITSGSHVLMSISLKDKKRIEVEGDGIGLGSREWSDRWERSMVTETGWQDTFRGPQGQPYLRQKELRHELGVDNPAPYMDILEDGAEMAPEG